MLTALMEQNATYFLFRDSTFITADHLVIWYFRLLEFYI